MVVLSRDRSGGATPQWEMVVLFLLFRRGGFVSLFRAWCYIFFGCGGLIPYSHVVVLSLAQKLWLCFLFRQTGCLIPFSETVVFPLLRSGGHIPCSEVGDLIPYSEVVVLSPIQKWRCFLSLRRSGGPIRCRPFDHRPWTTNVQVLRDSLRLYGPVQLIGSYNGGKDAVVIMHLHRYETHLCRIYTCSLVNGFLSECSRLEIPSVSWVKAQKANTGVPSCELHIPGVT